MSWEPFSDEPIGDIEWFGSSGDGSFAADSLTTGSSSTATTTAMNDYGDIPEWTHEKDSILFVIDCQEKMFESSVWVPNDDDNGNGEEEQNVQDSSNDDGDGGGPNVKQENSSSNDTAAADAQLAVASASAASASSSVQSSSSSAPASLVASAEAGNGSSDAFDGKLRSPFHVAMQMVAQFMSDKIVQGGGDLLGTVLYNVAEKSNQFDFEGVHVLHDIDVPDAAKIKQAERMSETDKEQFKQMFGDSKRHLNLHEVFWSCQHLFSHVPKNVGYKRIFLLTCDDNPIDSNADLRKKVLERVHDMADSDIMLDLFVLGVAENRQHFRHDKFWHHIIPRDEDEDDPNASHNGMNFDAVQHLQELKKSLKCRAYRKRGLLTFPLHLGADNSENSAITVTLYNTVMRAKKPQFTWLHSDTNKPIRKMTAVRCAATGVELMPSDIAYCYDYGSERIRFEPEELMQLKKLGSQGTMQLIGFKPRDRLKIYHNMSSPGFIYPNENRTQGSTTAFAALHRKMIEMNKIAICRFTPRKGSMPVYVALLPQAHEVDEHGEIVDSNGFHMIYLPYADGIRKLSFPEKKVVATREQIELAKAMVNKINTEYDTESFYNPALQQQYAQIQSMALDKLDSEATATDYTLPDYAGMERYKSYVDKFRDAVFPEGYTGDVKKKTRKTTASRSTAASGTKRKRAVKEDQSGERDDNQQESSSTRSTKKRRVKAADEEEEEEIDMVQLAKDGKLNKLTVPILREFCTAYKIKGGKRKQELIDSITDFLRRKGKI